MAGLLISLLASSPSAAVETGEYGNVCLEDLKPGAACTSNIPSITGLENIQILDGCNGPADTAQVRFDVVANNSGISRADVGFFFGLGGGNATSGDDCYHDYLSPPFTEMSAALVVNGPWFEAEFGDGDLCGDFEDGSQIKKTVPSATTTFTLGCVDLDEDGFADLEICLSHDTVGTNLCTSLAGAIPGSTIRCGCARYNVEGLTIGPATTTTTTTTTTTMLEADPCNDTPLPGCQAAAANKSTLVMSRDASDPSRDRLKWIWKSSDVVTPAEFGAPDADSRYDVCAYAGGGVQLRIGTSLPPDGDCTDRSCWEPTNSGFKYSGDGAGSGVRVLSLTASSVPGKSRIVVIGKGAPLALPSLLLPTPMLIQLSRDDAPSECWEATFSTYRKSEIERFSALSD